MQSPEERSVKVSSALWVTACTLGASAVILGAFGSHGLKRIIQDPSKIASWSTATQYQIYHSIVLLGASQIPTARLSSGLFITGITLFSGSIYLLVLNPARFRFLGPVTPLGGLCLIGGWIALAFAKPASMFAGHHGYTAAPTSDRSD
ncbi:uncharacterized protein BJ171DRAFT_558048 [Polychytrium aggregatum]|uniref:uncharacterized protein n=1 Tax=Polychytrium aggregatum TaxID=110093 RepID=UPI0022FDB243|nr:uncharacterized protein BJ171DRAFT_558048 [Polychytrium aggregatum]KAI9207212.1 hypothetical protein BJ171DRAFT_558048 [Polychytrium aggregatum]